MKSATASYCDSDAISGRCAGSGSASGGTGNSCSPERWSGVRLVTSSFSCGAAASSSASAGAASTSCSKLSRTSSSRLSARNSFRRSASGAASLSLRPTVCAIGRQHEREVGDRLERDEVHALRELLDELAPRPGARAGSCRIRPGRSASAAGRLPATAARRRPRARARARSAASAASAGSSAGSRACAAAGTRRGARRSTSCERRCGARQVLEPVLAEVAERDTCRAARPRRARGSTRDSSTWPPWAAAQIRAARDTSRPR